MLWSMPLAVAGNETLSRRNWESSAESIQCLGLVNKFGAGIVEQGGCFVNVLLQATCVCANSTVSRKGERQRAPIFLM